MGSSRADLPTRTPADMDPILGTARKGPAISPDVMPFCFPQRLTVSRFPECAFCMSVSSWCQVTVATTSA
jgi:hypothetical protein